MANYKIQETKKKKSSAINRLIVALALCLLAFGGCGLWQYFSATQGRAKTLTTDIVTQTLDDPEEAKPDCSTFSAPADQPRAIAIPSLDINGCVQRVGVDQHGAIAAPNNVHVAGWYVDSVLPGQPGVSLIDGHVSGRYTAGIFKRLPDVAKGSEISVEFGDKTTQAFKVVDVITVSVEEAGVELLRQVEGVEKQLTLITCTGRFNSQTQQYEQRTIVRASRI